MSLAELSQLRKGWKKASAGKHVVRIALLVAILVSVASARPAFRKPQNAPAKPQTTTGKPQAATQAAADDAGLKEFSSRVQAYVKLHKQMEGTLPKLKPTDQTELINAHQQALATKIREARPDVKAGNIFTPDAKAAFTQAIAQEFKSDDAKNARATIQQGAPISYVQLQVNQIYPEGMPYTTVPPTLLLKFPKLPDELAYRIVDSDLILLDVRANLVVDLMDKAIR